MILQHPREREKAIGTARMASLCLPNSELHVGYHWNDSAALARALSDPERPAALLYPGDGAVDVLATPPTTPITLVVIDGTWAQTRKLLRVNPALAALPRVAFTPSAPSDYRIRKEPHAECVSTIEALVYVLGALEGDAERFRPLLDPFRAMVDSQIGYAQTVRAVRMKHARGPRAPRTVEPPSARLPGWVRARSGHMVCVSAEGIGWPYAMRGPDLALPYPDELIHWVARRLATGETFERVIAPVHPLAPNTTTHTALSAETIHGGVSPEVFLADWRAWARDDDLLCAWGLIAFELLEGAGAFVPEGRFDFRELARLASGHVVRTAGAFITLLGLPEAPTDEPAAVVCAGRAGERLEALMQVARHFLNRPAA